MDKGSPKLLVAVDIRMLAWGFVSQREPWDSYWQLAYEEY
jgi:hypothetical protein